MEVLIGARADPGPRRRRPDRAGPGRHRHDGLPARAWPLQRLHRCDLRPRHRQRPPRRWPARRHRRLALVLLRRPPGRAARLRRAPEDPAPARGQARGPHRLPRRHPPHRRRLAAARLGLPRRQTSSPGAPGPAACSSSAPSSSIVAAIYVEAFVAKDPIIPLRLFKDRTTALATDASVLIGVAMFGSTVYLCQYFQLARGMCPTHAGLMSICMVGGLLVSSIISGRIITETGMWKSCLIGGMVAGHRRPRPARHHRRHHPAGRRRLHGRARPRSRRHDAEPRAGRAEQRRRGRPGLRLSSSSRSSARWAARSVSPRWVRVLSHQVSDHVQHGSALVAPVGARRAASPPRPALDPGPGALPAPIRASSSTPSARRPVTSS